MVELFGLVLLFAIDYTYFSNNSFIEMYFTYHSIPWVHIQFSGFLRCAIITTV